MNCAYRRHTWIALACSLLGAGCASQTTPAALPSQTSPASDGSRVSALHGASPTVASLRARA
jgi:hypothetical protein